MQSKPGENTENLPSFLSSAHVHVKSLNRVSDVHERTFPRHESARWKRDRTSVTRLGPRLPVAAAAFHLGLTRSWTRHSDEECASPHCAYRNTPPNHSGNELHWPFHRVSESRSDRSERHASCHYHRDASGRAGRRAIQASSRSVRRIATLYVVGYLGSLASGTYP